MNNAYIAKRQLEYDVCQGRWTDAGTFESYLEANQLLSATQNRVLSHA